jgi:uncharacterized protein (TIGR02611 family)
VPARRDGTLGEVSGVLQRLAGRMGRLRGEVRRRPGGALLWRILVLIVGVTCTVGGLLLVPLPGPGWVVVFLGLSVLGTEFRWARRLLDWTKEKVWDATAWAASQPPWMRIVGGLVTVMVVVGLMGGFLAWQQRWPFGA